jgi:hypothetical protein
MTTVDVPWIVSIDDHVIEPPSLWSSRLPAKYRAVGPLVDYWVYEDLYQSLNARSRRRVATATT